MAKKWIILLLPLLLWAGVAFAQTAPSSPPTSEMPREWIIGTIFFFFSVVGLYFWYMKDLRDKFFTACEKSNQLALFLESQAGLPSGTVRMTIAMLLITVSLYFMVLQAFLKFPFPESLTALLGTVIGFYFGSRSSSSNQDEGLKTQVKVLTKDLEEKTEEHKTVSAESNKSKVEQILNKVKKGIKMSESVASFLPPDIRKPYEETVAKLKDGLAKAETLANGGSAIEALTHAGDLLKTFQGENPVKRILEKASASFAGVLGGSVPQIALIAGIVGVSTKLVGVAYDKWRSRILHAPISAAVFPLAVVDANTGFILLCQSPIFKTVFSKEIEDNDRPFMKDAISLFLKEESTETLFTQYQARFESRDQFEQGLQDFRRNAVGLELEGDIQSAWIADVGGHKPLMAAIDKIHTDPAATADLDTLVTVVENLQSKGEPVESIFNKAISEIKP